MDYSVSNISSLSAVSLNYSFDNNYRLKNKDLYFGNDFKLNDNELFQKIVDIKVNKNTLLALTDKIQLKDYFEALETVSTLGRFSFDESLTLAASPLKFGYNAAYLAKIDEILSDSSDVGLTNSDNYAFLLNSSFETLLVTDEETSATSFEFEFFTDEVTGLENRLVSVKTLAGYYITLQGDLDDENSLSITVGLEEEITDDTLNRQKFHFLLKDDKLSLFTAVPNWTISRAIYYDLSDPLEPLKLSDSPIDESNDLTSEYVFIIEKLTPSSFTFRVGESFLAKYDTIKNSANLNLSSSLSSVDCQYLITTPYRTSSDNELAINILNLKNYLTPEGNLVQNDAREYNSIISGDNQETGNENLFLTYSSAYKEMRFKAGELTYFHFPLSAVEMSLSASGLIENGAISGKSPEYSDRIYKKNTSGYGQFTNWGNSKTTVKDGRYLCSWLYEGVDGNSPIWMDRYFDNSSVTSADPTVYSTTYSSSLTVYDFENESSNLYIYDVPSTMTFDSGVLYAYRRYGQKDVLEAISNESSHLQLAYENEYTEEVYNSGITATKGTITNFNTNTNIVNSNLYPLLKPINMFSSLTIGETISINEDSIFEKDEFTISFWLNFRDWDNIVGDQIIGNYFDGGFGIFINNKTLNPFITIYDSTSNLIHTLNSSFKEINYIEPYYLSATHIKNIRRDYDKTDFTLVQDLSDSMFKLIERDVEGNIKSAIAMDSLYTGIATMSSANFYTDGDNNIHILINGTEYKKFSKSNSIYTQLYSSSVSESFFVVDNNNVAQFSQEDYNITETIIGGLVNSENDIYWYSETKLYKNDQILWQTYYGILDLAIDEDDYLYCFYDNNKFVKLDKEGVVQGGVTIEEGNRYYGDVKIGLFNRLKDNNSKTFGHYIVDNLKKKIYFKESDIAFSSVAPVNQLLTDDEGNVLSTFYSFYLELGGLEGQGYSIIDFSEINAETAVQKIDMIDNGYNWQRQYSKYTNGKLSVRAKFVQKLFDANYYDFYSEMSLDEAVSGWNHFAISFNNKSNLKIYLNGELKTTTKIPFDNIVTNYENFRKIKIFSNVGKNIKLATETKEDRYWQTYGLFTGLKIYDKEYSSDFILALWVEYLKQEFNQDLIWSLEMLENRGFVEQIDKFYQHKVPGFKSQFFNLRINNFGNDDEDIRSAIEKDIRNGIEKLKPIHLELNNIEWFN